MTDFSDIDPELEQFVISTHYTEELIKVELEKREEILLEALKEGYDGVDFYFSVPDSLDWNMTHDPSILSKCEKWNAPPPNRKDGGERYDFRYYDRELLIRIVETGEIPDGW